MDTHTNHIATSVTVPIVKTFHRCIPVITIRGEIYSSKNSHRLFKSANGGRFITKSARAKGQELNLHAQLIAQRQNWWEMIRMVNTPFRIRFAFVRSTHCRFDYVNIVQGLLDAMVKAGYIPDDDADHVIPSFEPYTVDKHNPLTIIKLETADNDDIRPGHR